LSIVLTAKGRASSRRISQARATAIKSLIEDLSGEDRRALVVIVDALVSTATVQRLTARERGEEPVGWLCRLCDLTSCGRPEGQCPAATTARARPLAGP
jgi:hypothetical protein